MSHAKNTEKNAEDTEKNTGAVALAIPWASAPAAPTEAAAATGSVPAAEPAESTRAAKPKDRPEEPGHSDASERILSLRERFFRGGDIWAHLVFILVAAYALNYVTHAAADDIYVYRLGAVSWPTALTDCSSTASARAACPSPTRRLRPCSSTRLRSSPNRRA